MAKTEKNRWILGKPSPMRIVLLAVLAVVVLIGAFTLLKGKKPVEEAAEVRVGNAQANIANGGTAVSAGEALYLASPSLNGGIVKVKPGELEGEAVAGLSGTYLNVDGDTLYYVDGQTKYLMRSKLDGTGAVALVEKPVSRLQLCEDYLYYLDLSANNTLWRLDKQAQQAPALLSDARMLQYAVERDRIFYHDLNQGGAGFYMALDGDSPKEIILHMGKTIFGTGKYMFFSDEDRGGAISYITIDSQGLHGPVRLDTGVATNAVADEHYLYYVKARDGRMYRMDYAAQEPREQEMTDFAVCGLQLAGDYIYYTEVTGEGAMGCLPIGQSAATEG